MKIVVLHYHKNCPECGQDSCFYVDFQTDEDGCKMASGLYECDNCHAMIPSEAFHELPEVTMMCPSTLSAQGAKQ